jgi:hypothetical protein
VEVGLSLYLRILDSATAGDTYHPFGIGIYARWLPRKCVSARLAYGMHRPSHRKATRANYVFFDWVRLYLPAVCTSVGQTSQSVGVSELSRQHSIILVFCSYEINFTMVS